MTRLILVTIWAWLALSGSTLVGASSLDKQRRQTRQCSTGAFGGIVLPSGVSMFIEQATMVPENGSFGEGAVDLGFPANALALPKLCAVIVNITNTSATSQSNYRLGIFLPDMWNSKLLTIGSASFAGGINWVGMGEGPHYQSNGDTFALLTLRTYKTDNGHNSIQSDLSWATPATLLDWGYRAMHGSVQIGKLVTKVYYGQNITRSYYSSCSTGGRQGLKEIQVSPDSFDGALIGAPAWDTKYLMPWITKIAFDVLNVSVTDQLTIPNMTFLRSQILAQCDGIDGHNDNIVSWPEQCQVNFTQMQCSSTVRPPNCLTPVQIATAKKIYGDYVTSNGTFIHNGFEISSESQWLVYLAGTSPTVFDADYERYWLYNDPSYQTKMYNDSTAYLSINKNPGQATADQYKITDFKNRGGKIMMYHGMSDGLVPTKSSMYYYNQTAKAMPETPLQDFFRYFQVPGMQHCYGTDPSVVAPWMFAGGGQAAFLQQPPYYFGSGWSVPGFENNSTFDALLALMNWVEHDIAIEQVVATAWVPFSADVARQRPICPWPQKATYRSGNENDFASWYCA